MPQRHHELLTQELAHDDEAVDVAGDAPVRRDVSVRAPAAPTARRGLFSCAATPGIASRGCAVWAALAVAHEFAAAYLEAKYVIGDAHQLGVFGGLRFAFPSG